MPVADTGRDMEIEMRVSFMKPGMNLKISLENENIFNFEEVSGSSLFNAEDKDAGNNPENISANSSAGTENIKTDAADNVKNMKAGASQEDGGADKVYE